MRRRSADSGREGLNEVADSIDPQGFHIAFVNTRMPGLNTFQIRDLRTLLRLGVRIDLYLYDMNSLDSDLREEIERLGGRVERIGLPTDIRALFSCFVEVLRNPIQLLRGAYRRSLPLRAKGYVRWRCCPPRSSSGRDCEHLTCTHFGPECQQPPHSG